MTFVQEQQKEDDAIRELQERKRKDLEDQIKKRGQAVKNHKVENLQIPATQEFRLPDPPSAMITAILVAIINGNYPPITDHKNVDPKFFDRQPTPLNKSIQLVMDQIQKQHKANNQDLTDQDRTLFMNQIFACIRELKLYGFIEFINNTEEGVLVKVAPKALQYINSINYFTLPNQLREQYGIYTTLIPNV